MHVVDKFSTSHHSILTVHQDCRTLYLQSMHVFHAAMNVLQSSCMFSCFILTMCCFLFLFSFPSCTTVSVQSLSHRSDNHTISNNVLSVIMQL